MNKVKNNELFLSFSKENLERIFRNEKTSTYRTFNKIIALQFIEAFKNNKPIKTAEETIILYLTKEPYQTRVSISELENEGYRLSGDEPPFKKVWVLNFHWALNFSEEEIADIHSKCGNISI